jgi:hypothetical protein
VAAEIALFPGRSGVYILHSDAESELAARTEVLAAAHAAEMVLLPYGEGNFHRDHHRVYYWLAERAAVPVGRAGVTR